MKIKMVCLKNDWGFPLASLFHWKLWYNPTALHARQVYMQGKCLSDHLIPQPPPLQCLVCRTHDLIWRLSLIKIILSLGFLYCCVLTQVSYQQDEKSQIGWNLWGSIESDLKAIWSTHDSPSLSKDKTLKLSSRRPHWWRRGEIC